MIILSQNRKLAINNDNVGMISVNGAYIQAYLIDGSNASLGYYGDNETAQKVFEKYFVKNVATLIAMPEEP